MVVAAGLEPATSRM